jgi:hypothetical protein
MPLRKRSKAAVKGWKTRRANEQKRSNASKKGWKTRRENEILKEATTKLSKRYQGSTIRSLPKNGIVRAKYGKRDFEIRRRNGKTVEIRVGKSVYTRPGDLARFDALINAADLFPGKLSRGNRSQRSRR